MNTGLRPGKGWTVKRSGLGLLGHFFCLSRAFGRILPDIEGGGHGRNVKASRELVIPEADPLTHSWVNLCTGAAVLEAVGAQNGLVNAPAGHAQV